eukprot:165025_1
MAHIAPTTSPHTTHASHALHAPSPHVASRPQSGNAHGKDVVGVGRNADIAMAFVDKPKTKKSAPNVVTVKKAVSKFGGSVLTAFVTDSTDHQTKLFYHPESSTLRDFPDFSEPIRQSGAKSQ